eukprot:scaffold242196_cov17-Prasinocladus_malaysianus.AAC.1
MPRPVEARHDMYPSQYELGTIRDDIATISVTTVVYYHQTHSVSTKHRYHRSNLNERASNQSNPTTDKCYLVRFALQCPATSSDYRT